MASLGYNELTHLPLLPQYMLQCTRVNIGSDNGLSIGRCHAIIWTNAGILLIGPLGINFSEILIEIHKFLFKKMHLEVSSVKWRPFCPGRAELSESQLCTAEGTTQSHMVQWNKINKGCGTSWYVYIHTIFHVMYVTKAYLILFISHSVETEAPVTGSAWSMDHGSSEKKFCCLVFHTRILWVLGGTEPSTRHENLNL